MGDDITKFVDRVTFYNVSDSELLLSLSFFGVTIR